MLTYQFYTFDAHGNRSDGRNLICMDDEGAMALAERMVGDIGRIDVRRGGNFIGEVCRPTRQVPMAS